MARVAIKLTLDDPQGRSDGRKRTDDGLAGKLRVFDLGRPAVRAANGRKQDGVTCIQPAQPLQGGLKLLPGDQDMVFATGMRVPEHEQLLRGIIT